MIECDVAIVGAGPAGCAAARECTRKGLTTVIVEKKKIPRHKACSGILVPASINVLSEHFGDVPQDVKSLLELWIATVDRQKLSDAHDDDPGRIGVGGLRGLGQR